MYSSKASDTYKILCTCIIVRIKSTRFPLIAHHESKPSSQNDGLRWGTWLAISWLSLQSKSISSFLLLKVDSNSNNSRIIVT